MTTATTMATTTTTTTTTNKNMAQTLSLVLLLVLFLSINNAVTVNGQFNEPPGQRREQTYRILEYEASNINQHYTGLLRYYCTFRGKWSKERHPNDFPSSPSFSAPIIVSHSKNYRLWTGTETVTAGIEYVAEEGYPTVMYNEFANAGYESLQMVVGERMFNTTESQHLPPINVTYSHPWLSSITKIVPSPDWFVGFSDLRMISYDTETYYSRIVIQSYVWDSGTDDGQTYLAFDRDMDPQEPCQRFCVPSKLLGNKGGIGNSDANIITHHPNGNSKKCPDKEKGRIRIPQGHQFVDYTGTYIPYPAEYECILRVDDTEIFTGNEFNETQIRPPKNVKRPDDDFLDGLSPYDQPTYDNHLAKYYGTEPPLADDDNNNNDWNKNMLWILLLILICCCPCACFGVYFFIKSNKKSNKNKNKSGVDEFSVLEDEYQDEFLDLANTSYRGGGGRYDDDGNPIVEYDEDGNPIHIVEYDEDGNPIVEFDDDGNPIERYDENGMPIVRYDIDGNPIDYWDSGGGGGGGGDNGGGSDMRNSSRSMNSMRSNNSTRSTRSTRSTHSTHSTHSTRSTHEEAADNDYDSYLDSQRLKAEQENASYRSNRTTGGGGGAGDSYRSNRSTGGGAGDSYRSHQML